MSSVTTKSYKQARIMIWSTPRSVSTAFARSMGARGDTEVFWEPYLACYSFGPERQVTWGDHVPGMINYSEKYTYSYIKGLLEEDHPNAKVLFVKGMIEGIRGKIDMVATGYKHSFLIRHPKKVFRSIEHMCKDGVPIDFKSVFKNIYQDVDNFYEYAQTTLGQQFPPILDADDVIAHPDKVLPKYCEAMGIEFTPKMLEWEDVETSQLNWHCTDIGPISNKKLSDRAVLSNAMQSTGFGKHVAPPKSDELSADVMECVQYAMPVYDKLYALRIKP